MKKIARLSMQSITYEISSQLVMESHFAVKLHEHLLEKETIFLVMDYCEMGALSDYLKEGNINVD